MRDSGSSQLGSNKERDHPTHAVLRALRRRNRQSQQRGISCSAKEALVASQALGILSLPASLLWRSQYHKKQKVFKSLKSLHLEFLLGYLLRFDIVYKVEQVRPLVYLENPRDERLGLATLLGYLKARILNKPAERLSIIGLFHGKFAVVIVRVGNYDVAVRLQQFVY